MLAPYAFSRSVAMAGSCFMLCGSRQTKDGHVAVEGLVLTLIDDICFMPDANAAIRADQAVETAPRLEVRIIAVARETLEVLEGVGLSMCAVKRPGMMVAMNISPG